MAKHTIVGIEYEKGEREDEGKGIDRFTLEEDVESEDVITAMAEWELFFDGKVIINAIPKGTTWQAV